MLAAGTWLIISAVGSLGVGIAYLQLFKYAPGAMTRATIATQAGFGCVQRYLLLCDAAHHEPLLLAACASSCPAKLRLCCVICRLQCRWRWARQALPLVSGERAQWASH